MHALTVFVNQGGKLVNIFILWPNLLPWKCHTVRFHCKTKEETNKYLDKQDLHTPEITFPKKGENVGREKMGDHHCLHILILFLGRESLNKHKQRADDASPYTALAAPLKYIKIWILKKLDKYILQFGQI